jgi:hypothetical protein
LSGTVVLFWLMSVLYVTVRLEWFQPSEEGTAIDIDRDLPGNPA